MTQRFTKLNSVPMGRSNTISVCSARLTLAGSACHAASLSLTRLFLAHLDFFGTNGAGTSSVYSGVPFMTSESSVSSRSCTSTKLSCECFETSFSVSIRSSEIPAAKSYAGPSPADSHRCTASRSCR